MVIPTCCFSIVGLRIFTSLSRYRSQWGTHLRLKRTHKDKQDTHTKRPHKQCKTNMIQTGTYMRDKGTNRTYKTENRTEHTKDTKPTNWMYTRTKRPTECARQKIGLIILNTQTKVQSCSKVKHTINYRSQYNRIQFSNIEP